MPADQSAIQRAAATIARSFALDGHLTPLPGGEGRTYRAGATVYRQEADATEAAYLAEVYHDLPAAGFRVPRPIRASAGGWVSPEGWSAWGFVDGRPLDSLADLPTLIAATHELHRALATRPYPAYLNKRDTPYDRADRAAWGDLPAAIDSGLAPFAARLDALRKPLPDRSAQLIHGDLSPGNVLVAPGLPPAFIDLTPYWRPPAFALAVMAYWLGPYRGDRHVLDAFAAVPDFAQMLVRAALRTLLVDHEFARLGRPSAPADFQTPVALVVDWVQARANP